MVANDKLVYLETVEKYLIKYFLPPISRKFAMSFGLGSGNIVPTAKLSNSFSSSLLYSLTMDFNVNKVYSSIYLLGGTVLLDTPFSAIKNSDSLVFDKNEEFNFLDGGIALGYFLVRDSNFHVAPYLSISGNKIESMVYSVDEEENGKEEYEIYNSLTTGLGVHFEYKFYQYTMEYPFYTSIKIFMNNKTAGVDLLFCFTVN